MVRPIDELDARLLPGTEAAAYPFWAPDSRSVGFFAQGKLKVVALAGGPPTMLNQARPLALHPWMNPLFRSITQGDCDAAARP